MKKRTRKAFNNAVINKVALVYIIIIGIKTVQTLSPLGHGLDASGYALNLLWLVMVVVYFNTRMTRKERIKARVKKAKRKMPEYEENDIFSEKIRVGDYALTLSNRVPVQVLYINRIMNRYIGEVVNSSSNKLTGQYIEGNFTNLEKIIMDKEAEQYDEDFEQ